MLNCFAPGLRHYADNVGQSRQELNVTEILGTHSKADKTNSMFVLVPPVKVSIAAQIYFSLKTITMLILK